MKLKFIASTIIIGVLAFILGWFCHKNFISDSFQQTNINLSRNGAPNFSGRYIMKDSKCAGFNFISNTRVTWTNEIDCNHPDTLKIRWINNSTFYVQDINPIDNTTPPRVWIYQIISYHGNCLTLKDIWTGWNNHSDELIELIKQ